MKKKKEEQSAIYKCGFGRGVTNIILLEEGLKIYRGVENVSEKGGLNKKGVKRKEREGGEYDLQGNYEFRFPTRIF